MTIKFKGRKVEINGVVVAEIYGWRDPAGKSHKPYVIELIDGTVVKQFAYCDDARKHCKFNIIDKLTSLAGN